MSHELWAGLFVVFAILTFFVFGMQRATMRLSREAGVAREVTQLLLPPWAGIVWFLIIGKWLLVVAIAVFWDWKVALGFVAADTVLIAVLPIPYGLYFPIFRRQASGIEGPEGAELLAILDRSRLMSPARP